MILGAGPAGLLFTQYLRRVLGFDGLLLVSEPNARKRDLAAAFGAKAIDPASQDIIEAVGERTGGRMAELVNRVIGRWTCLPPSSRRPPQARCAAALQSWVTSASKRAERASVQRTGPRVASRRFGRV